VVEGGQHAFEMVQHRVVGLEAGVLLRGESALILGSRKRGRQQRHGAVAALITAATVEEEFDLVAANLSGLKSRLVGSDDGSINDRISRERRLFPVPPRRLLKLLDELLGRGVPGGLPPRKHVAIGDGGGPLRQIDASIRRNQLARGRE
jgi:hypothetical protein